jgi:hypothetical protein
MVDYSFVIISRTVEWKEGYVHHFCDVDCRGTRGVVWYGMTRPRHASGLPKRRTETELRARVSYILEVLKKRITVTAY